MRVHLLRSQEYSPDRLNDVMNLLARFKGPIEFVAAETTIAEPSIGMRTWDDEESFSKQEEIISYDSLKSPNIVACMDFPLDEQEMTWPQLFAVCEKHRKSRNIPANESIFLLTDIGNEHNWFGCTNSARNDFFVQTSHWSHLFGHAVDERFPIAYEIVSWILRALIFHTTDEMLKAVHARSTGCFMDFCLDKREIVMKLRTADICPKCMEKIEEREVNKAVLQQILATMEGIRENLLFRRRSSYLNQPSRMLVNGYTKRLFLSDLGDLEIALNPKEKTMYLFYLNHPEGVRLVDLIDHRSELQSLYARFARQGDTEQQDAALDRLLDPTDDNINQVMSRIRAKFRAALGDVQYKHFSIERKEDRFVIALNRELVRVMD